MRLKAGQALPFLNMGQNGETGGYRSIKPSNAAAMPVCGNAASSQRHADAPSAAKKVSISRFTAYNS